MNKNHRGFFNFYKKISLENPLLILVSSLIGLIVFESIDIKEITYNSTSAIISNILTINGVFSAILITYLFTRISWIKDRKLEAHNEAVSHSQKLTEFRRILDKLTEYYSVWKDDSKTKSLLDHSKYKNIDYYEFHLATVSDYKPENYELIQQLLQDKNYSEGQSNLYLAMISLVRPRQHDYYWQEELYKDYKHTGIYSFEIVGKWLECDIMNTISFWLSDNYIMIQFYNLRSDFDTIKQAAGRIDKKYMKYDVGSKLVRELAEDMGSFYLKKLYSELKYLRTGIEGLNLVIVLLIFFSLFFGVLMPLIYLLVISDKSFYPLYMALLASINAVILTYFLIKFPFMIRKEIKWT